MTWVLCALVDLRDERTPPDFSKVPPERRELVRRRWRESFSPPTEVWKLWESQIPHYRRAGFHVIPLSEPEE